MLPQILGGAGPGLAQIPASIIWAGISVFELYYEAVRWGRSPLTLPPALMHVLFTLLSQLVGVSARFVMAVLALVPMERHGPLSDHAALQVCGVICCCAVHVVQGQLHWLWCSW